MAVLPISHSKQRWFAIFISAPQTLLVTGIAVGLASSPLKALELQLRSGPSRNCSSAEKLGPNCRPLCSYQSLAVISMVASRHIYQQAILFGMSSNHSAMKLKGVPEGLDATPLARLRAV
jgi:hypothetical protein